MIRVVGCVFAAEYSALNSGNSGFLSANSNKTTPLSSKQLYCCTGKIANLPALPQKRTMLDLLTKRVVDVSAGEVLNPYVLT